MSTLARIITDPTRRVTVDEYHSMIQAGTLTEDEAVELIADRRIEVDTERTNAAGSAR